MALAQSSLIISSTFCTLVSLALPVESKITAAGRSPHIQCILNYSSKLAQGILLSVRKFSETSSSQRYTNNFSFGSVIVIFASKAKYLPLYGGKIAIYQPRVKQGSRRRGSIHLTLPSPSCMSVHKATSKNTLTSYTYAHPRVYCQDQHLVPDIIAFLEYIGLIKPKVPLQGNIHQRAI